MGRALTLLCLAAVVAACSQKEEAKPTAPAAGIAKMAPAGDAAAIASLVPADTTLLLRISSVQKLEEITNRLSTELPLPPVPDVLGMTAVLGLDPAAVERDRPLFLCANLGEKDAPPLLTLIAPVEDPDAIAKTAAGQGAAVAEGYVALSQMKTDPRSGGSPLTAGILAGDISSRCDLAHVVRTYRDDIEEGLRWFEEAFAEGTRQGLPTYDPGEMTRKITDWVRRLVDSAETLDAVVNHDKGHFDVQVALTASEASPLARAAARTKTELAALGRCLPPDMPVTLLLHFDIAGMNDLVLPMLSALMEKRTDEERREVEDSFRRMSEASEMLTDDWAMALDFGKGGMRVAMVGGARDAQAYLVAYRELMQAPALAQMGMEVKSEGSREVAGTKVERMRMTIDVQKYMEFLGLEEYGPEAAGGLNAAMALMFGEDGLVFELAAREKRLYIAAGPSGLMDHMLGADDPPPWLEGTAAAIGGELAFLIRLEMRGCMRGVSEMMAELMPGMPAPSYADGKDLPVVLYGSIDGRVYRGGLTCNLADLAAFFREEGAERK